MRSKKKPQIETKGLLERKKQTDSSHFKLHIPTLLVILGHKEPLQALLNL